jgi:hypothetical protein
LAARPSPPIERTSDASSTFWPRSIVRGDLDPHALESGIVIMRSTGFTALWARCRARRMDVLADVHTHPDEHLRKSEADRTNPFIPEVGHVVLCLNPPPTA